MKFALLIIRLLPSRKFTFLLCIWKKARELFSVIPLYLLGFAGSPLFCIGKFTPGLVVECGLRSVLRITLKSLLRALNISGRLAFMISFVVPLLLRAFLFYIYLQVHNISRLVVGTAKYVYIVPFIEFMSSVLICRHLSWLLCLHRYNFPGD